jgi:hypothetical protein
MKTGCIRTIIAAASFLGIKLLPRLKYCKIAPVPNYLGMSDLSMKSSFNATMNTSLILCLEILSGVAKTSCKSTPLAFWVSVKTVKLSSTISEGSVLSEPARIAAWVKLYRSNEVFDLTWTRPFRLIFLISTEIG